MRKHVLGLIFPLVCVLAFNCGCGTVAADPSQQNSVTRAAQIFTLTTSDPATFSDPSGAIQPMPSTSLNVQMQEHTLTFKATKDGKVTLTGRVAISADGKTRTVNVTATDAKGNKASGTAVYEKQ
jgi:hypothetical protein